MQEKAIGHEMAQFIPQDGKRWWQRAGLLRLNLCIFSCFLLSAANGFDGSMMNGLQALPQWHVFMDNPTYVTPVLGNFARTDRLAVVHGSGSSTRSSPWEPSSCTLSSPIPAAASEGKGLLRSDSSGFCSVQHSKRQLRTQPCLSLAGCSLVVSQHSSLLPLS